MGKSPEMGGISVIFPEGGVDEAGTFSPKLKAAGSLLVVA